VTTEKSSPLRIGIVGCGDISHTHAKAALAIPEKVRIVACCDIRTDIAAAWAAQFGCEGYYSDYAQMISDARIDAVLLATWPNQHREQIERCLQTGINNILCEKALALTGSDALDIYKLVAAYDAFLMEGVMYRHHPAIAHMDAMVIRGEIGEIDCVRADFSAYDPEEISGNDENRNWRQRKECGGGITYDFTSYCVNACNHFANGSPARVYCRGDISDRYGTVNRMFALIEYENGVVGMIESSKKANHSQRLEVAGSSGRVSLPIAWAVGTDVDVYQQQCIGWAKLEQTPHRVSDANAHQLQLKNFVDVIHAGTRPVMRLSESVVNIFTLEALVQSMTDECPVTVSLPDGLR
jgi:predicted dehydrogenase